LAGVDIIADEYIKKCLLVYDQVVFGIIYGDERTVFDSEVFFNILSDDVEAVLVEVGLGLNEGAEGGIDEAAGVLLKDVLKRVIEASEVSTGLKLIYLLDDS
jgi:hypothetical protein